MKIPKKLVDENPTQTPGHLSVVTLLKTDRSRNAKKGDIGTVVDVNDIEKWGYGVDNDHGEVHHFRREEFRLATPEDVARGNHAWEKQWAKKEAKKQPLSEPPEMPEWMK